MSSKLAWVSALLAANVMTASAQPGAMPPLSSEDGESPATDDSALAPPSSVEVAPIRSVPIRKSPLATTERWGGGGRVTGLSGIGALPGVNYGGEVSGMVRRDEMFAELGFGWWKPEKTYLVAEQPDRVELGLKVWTLRAGWASMTTPLRAWGLVEVGELASAHGMPGVVTRMMTGDTPQERQWHAVGGGFGVAWPMSDNARLFGMIEIAVPVERERLMLDTGAYEPDPMAARSSAGIELGWR
ncbi:MAG TPA: hypothetical protein VFV99_31105 [Kofleriaceae bacterium]|nr:hypothetical protein [Kofleriaceae bacterium]